MTLSYLTSSKHRAISPSGNELHTCDEELAGEAEALLELVDDLITVDTEQTASDTAHSCPTECSLQSAFSSAVAPAVVAAAQVVVAAVEDSEVFAEVHLKEEEEVSDWQDWQGRCLLLFLQSPR